MGGADSEGANGGRGAVFEGARGARFSGSLEYESLRSAAPVSIPPRFFSFGIPPAKRPPNCGAVDKPPPSVLTAGVSLLALALLLPPGGGGGGGARPPGAFIPGIGGAPPTGRPALLFVLPTTGADRSFVTVDLSFLPFEMSPSRAP